MKKYISKKAKPPLAPILYGNPQILPRPIATPIAAIRNPKLDLKLPLFPFVILLSSPKYKWFNYSGTMIDCQ